MASCSTWRQTTEQTVVSPPDCDARNLLFTIIVRCVDDANVEQKASQLYFAVTATASAISNDENGRRHLCLFIRIFINNFFQIF